MFDEERDRLRELNNARVRAVNLARRHEVELIKRGEGTRNWSKAEQREWIRTGKCKGYEGQHMKSVNGHEEYAGDKNNIQWLTKEEHLKAHSGSFRNQTNGYYNPETGRIYGFGNEAPKQPASHKLSDPLSENAIKYNTTLKEKAVKQRYEAKRISETKEIKRQVERSTPSNTLRRDRTNKDERKESKTTQSQTLDKQRQTAQHTNIHSSLNNGERKSSKHIR